MASDFEWVKYLAIIFDTVYILAGIFILMSFCMGLKNKTLDSIKPEHKTCAHRSLPAMGISFICCTTLAFVLHLYYVTTLDGIVETTGVEHGLYIAMSGMQLMLLCVLWFLRIYVAFYGSQHQVRDCVVYGFIVYYILMLIFLGGIVGVQDGNPLRTPFVVGLAITFPILVIGLAVMFIYKLCKIRRYDYAKDIRELVIKITILNLTTVFIVMLAVALRFVTSGGFLITFSKVFFFPVMNMTNLICIIFSYSLYHKYYFKLCSPVQESILLKCVGDPENVKTEKDLSGMVGGAPKSKTKEMSGDATVTVEPTTEVAENDGNAHNDKIDEP